MRLVAAHRTPLAESDSRAPSSSETRLRDAHTAWNHLEALKWPKKIPYTTSVDLDGTRRRHPRNPRGPLPPKL
eukprot:2018635-Prymnesium_polylepis.1